MCAPVSSLQQLNGLWPLTGEAEWGVRMLGFMVRETLRASLVLWGLRLDVLFGFPNLSGAVGLQP